MWTGEMLDEMLTSNARGTFLPMKYELEVMHRQGSGAIVNIGSGAGLLGVPGHSGYVASKHAGIGLTRSAALEYAADGNPRQRGGPRPRGHAAHPRLLRRAVRLHPAADRLPPNRTHRPR